MKTYAALPCRIYPKRSVNAAGCLGQRGNLRQSRRSYKRPRDGLPEADLRKAGRESPVRSDPLRRCAPRTVGKIAAMW